MAETVTKFRCPTCNKVFDKKPEYCDQCGTVTVLEQVFRTYNCKKCGNKFESSMYHDSCPKCGATLFDDECTICGEEIIPGKQSYITDGKGKAMHQICVEKK